MSKVVNRNFRKYPLNKITNFSKELRVLCSLCAVDILVNFISNFCRFHVVRFPCWLQNPLARDCRKSLFFRIVSEFLSESRKGFRRGIHVLRSRNSFDFWLIGCNRVIYIRRVFDFDILSFNSRFPRNQWWAGHKFW